MLLSNWFWINDDTETLPLEPYSITPNRSRRVAAYSAAPVSRLSVRPAGVVTMSRMPLSVMRPSGAARVQKRP